MESTKLTSAQREYETSNAKSLRLNLSKQLLIDCFNLLEDNIKQLVENYYADVQSSKNMEMGLEGLTSVVIAAIPGMELFAVLSGALKEGMKVFQKYKFDEQKDNILNKITDIFNEQEQSVRDNKYIM